MFVNPIMRKVAPLIISSKSILAEEPVAAGTTKHSYQNKTGKVTAKYVCLVHQEASLSKQPLWSH